MRSNHRRQPHRSPAAALTLVGAGFIGIVMILVGTGRPSTTASGPRAVAPAATEFPVVADTKEAVEAFEKDFLAAANALEPPKQYADPLDNPELQAMIAAEERDGLGGEPANVTRTPAGDGTIIEIGQGPFSGALIQNRWLQSPRGDGMSLVVYAGAFGVAYGAGVAAVSVHLYGPEGAWERALGEFEAPNGAGRSIRVVSANGDVLTLEDSEGNTYLFDVSKLAFVQ